MLMNMKELLAVANENNFAVPAFNISDYSMFNGIMEASEEKNAPVIIAIHPDELSHIGTDMVKAIIEKAHKATVPVCIHLDHGASFEQVMTAIQAGFTSVMIDGSSLRREYRSMQESGRGGSCSKRIGRRRAWNDRIHRCGSGSRRECDHLYEPG